MRACLLALAVLSVPASAHAGLYVDNAREPGPLIPLEKVYETIVTLRGAGVEPKGPLDKFSPRSFYLRQLDDLRARQANHTLSVEDRANLGGCLIRLGRTTDKDDTFKVLRDGLSSADFRVLANLATYHFVRGNYRDAILTQELLLRRWPAVVVGPRGTQLARYRECERALLRLMQMREKEQGRTTGLVELDALFPKVRFVGESGKYEPGRIARRYADELPPQAVDIVVQLCVWLPGDLRLFWLLGELLNAHGHVEWAHIILTSLVRKDDGVSFGSPFKDLVAHQAALERALPAMKALREGDLPLALFSAGQAVPLPNLAPGAAGPAALAAAAWAPLLWLPAFKEGRNQPPQLPVAPPRETAAAEPLPFNWRHISASFAFGVLAAGLIGLQWREWQRRRARRAALDAVRRETGNGPPVPSGDGDRRITGPPAVTGPS